MPHHHPWRLPQTIDETTGQNRHAGSVPHLTISSSYLCSAGAKGFVEAFQYGGSPLTPSRPYEREVDRFGTPGYPALRVYQSARERRVILKRPDAISQGDKIVHLYGCSCIGVAVAIKGFCHLTQNIMNCTVKLVGLRFYSGTIYGITSSCIMSLIEQRNINGVACCSMARRWSLAIKSARLLSIWFIDTCCFHFLSLLLTWYIHS